MSVDDFSIYGVPVSILIALVSTGIALLAVYYTSKSAKISHNQFELAQKMVEKPRILELIQTIINPIKLDLESEIKAIDNKELTWIVTTDIYYRPLIFPISNLRKFYKDFLHSFHAADLQRDSRLQDIIKGFGINIQKRYDIYQKINDTLQQFTDNINQSHFDQRIADLLEGTDHKISPPLESLKVMGNLSVSVRELNTITKEEVSNIIKSLIELTLLKSLEKNDPRLKWLGEENLTIKLCDNISQHLINDPVPHYDEIKQSIERDLVSLRDLDNNILTDIGKLKQIYQEIYMFKESELNPPQVMT